MLELRQLNLQLALPSPGALGKDVQDQRGAIQDFTIEDFFQVAALRRRKLIVKDYGVDIRPVTVQRKLVCLAFPMKVVAQGAAIFCKPSPTTSAPAVIANSESSSNDSRISRPFRVLSSTPTRKTRSVLRFLVSMSAFNSLGRFSLSFFPLFCFSLPHLCARKKRYFGEKNSEASLKRLALPQAGLRPQVARPDAPAQDLKPVSDPAYASLNFFLLLLVVVSTKSYSKVVHRQASGKVLSATVFPAQVNYGTPTRF